MEIAVERDNERDGRPVYLQIAEHIRARIEDGSLTSGARLPAIRDLARRLQVNRDTVAVAYEALSAGGHVESTVGRGTFVRSGVSPSAGSVARFQPTFSSLTEKLRDFERARPRFGEATAAAPMHSLVPDPSLYPADAFRKVLNRVLLEDGAELLLYGGPQGHRPLREILTQRFRGESLDVDPDQIVLCHGASQGIHLATRLFAEAGDAVALEEPTYNNVLGVMHGLGLRTVPVPMNDDGLDLPTLEQTLSRPDVKFLYTIPTFHNPTGVTTSLPHRQELLAIAARCGKPVVEDAYESDLRLSGRPLRSLAGLDPHGLVLHLFSFSKSLFPGARVGALTAPSAMVDALVALKQATDLSDSILIQAALAEFVSDGSYDRHLKKFRNELRRRRDAMLAALDRCMPEGVTWLRSDGGYQVWVSLPGGLDTGELLADAVGAGALFAPGFQFHHDGRPSNQLRLTFAMADAETLDRGIEALAEVIDQRLANGSRRTARVHI